MDDGEDDGQKEDDGAQEELDVVRPTAVFVDFDGTITDGDTFDVLVRRLAGEDVWLAFERSLDDGSRTLRDVLAAEAACVRGSFDEVVATLRSAIAVDPTFAAFAARCAEREYDVTILSSGVEPVIRDRLVELGVAHLRVIANGLDANPVGWRIVFRDEHAPNGTDKAAIVRAHARDGARTIFIGDGRSDYAAALEAELRFAKRNSALARYLTANGVRHEPFDAFSQIDF